MAVSSPQMPVTTGTSVLSFLCMVDLVAEIILTTTLDPLNPGLKSFNEITFVSPTLGTEGLLSLLRLVVPSSLVDL